MSCVGDHSGVSVLADGHIHTRFNLARAPDIMRVSGGEVGCNGCGFGWLVECM